MGLQSQADYAQQYDVIAAIMLDQPIAFFEQALDELRAYARRTGKWHLPKRVKVNPMKGRFANAEVRRRWWPRLGFTIEVNVGLPLLMFDTVQLMLGITTLTDPGGRILGGPDLSIAEARSVLEDSIRNYVLTRQWTGSAGLHAAWRARLQREAELPTESRKDWVKYLQHMIGFAVAHELSHILLGHPGTPVPDDQQERWKEEYAADALAAELLVNYLTNLDYEHVVPGGVVEFGQAMIQLVDLNLVSAFKAVAMFFTMLDLVERAAGELHAAGEIQHDWQGGHPRARDRFVRFRQCCVEKCGVRPELFTSAVVSGDVPPNITQLYLYAAALDLSWFMDPEVEKTLKRYPSISEGTHVLLSALGPSLFDNPQRTRRILDDLRRRLERQVKVQPTYDDLMPLVEANIFLSRVCRDGLDSPVEAALYESKANFYHQRVNQILTQLRKDHSGDDWDEMNELDSIFSWVENEIREERRRTMYRLDGIEPEGELFPISKFDLTL